MIKKIRRDFIIKEPIVSTHPYPFIVIDDFISRDLCEQLIKDSNNLANKNFNLVHGGRRMITWKSALFRDITKESSAWKNLEKELPKKAFNLFNRLITDKTKKSETYHKWKKRKSLRIRSNLYSLSSKLFSKSQYLRYLKNLELNCKSHKNNRLIILGLIGIIDSLYRNLLATFDWIRGSLALTPLFDYSISNVGYNREIHRDSDARAFVILLYLNDLEDNTEGGTLGIYEHLESLTKYPPQIPFSKAEKILEVHPRAGRLVIFFNQSNSYHAVDKMTYSKRGRHFIYGGLTMQNSLGSPSIKDSTKRSPTEYFFYK